MGSVWLLRFVAAAIFMVAACGGNENPAQPIVPPSYTFTVSGTAVVVTDLITKSITREQQAELERQCGSQDGVPLGTDCLGELVPQVGALPDCVPASGRCLDLALKNNGTAGVLRVRDQTPGGPACTGRLCDGVEIPADIVRSAGKKTPTSSSAPSSTTKSTSKTQVTTTKPSK